LNRKKTQSRTVLSEYAKLCRQHHAHNAKRLLEMECVLSGLYGDEPFQERRTALPTDFSLKKSQHASTEIENDHLELDLALIHPLMYEPFLDHWSEVNEADMTTDGSLSRSTASGLFPTLDASFLEETASSFMEHYHDFSPARGDLQDSKNYPYQSPHALFTPTVLDHVGDMFRSPTKSENINLPMRSERNTTEPNNTSNPISRESRNVYSASLDSPSNRYNAIPVTPSYASTFNTIRNSYDRTHFSASKMETSSTSDTRIKNSLSLSPHDNQQITQKIQDSPVSNFTNIYKSSTPRKEDEDEESSSEEADDVTLERSLDSTIISDRKWKQLYSPSNEQGHHSVNLTREDENRIITSLPQPASWNTQQSLRIDHYDTFGEKGNTKTQMTLGPNPEFLLDILSADEYASAPRLVKMQVTLQEMNDSIHCLQSHLAATMVSAKDSCDQGYILSEQVANTTLSSLFDDYKRRSILMSLCHFRRLLMRLPTANSGKVFIIPRRERGKKVQ